MSDSTMPPLREDVDAAIRRGAARILTGLIVPKDMDAALIEATDEVMAMFEPPKPDGPPALQVIRAIAIAAVDHPDAAVVLTHDKSTGEYGLGLLVDGQEHLQYVGAGWTSAHRED